jgi:surfeit locus 1 family protein
MLRPLIFPHLKKILSIKNSSRVLYSSSPYNRPPHVDLRNVGKRKSPNEKSENNTNSPPNQSKLVSVAFLAIPIITFGLGMWQVKRREWKLDLIRYMESRTEAEPIELPTDTRELEKLIENHEYKPFKARGYFLHSKEVLLSPRHDITGKSTMPGALVITPFVVSNNPNLVILVNRGYVPYTHYQPTSRQEGQINGEIEIVGLLRADEVTNTFTPTNIPPNEWHHRDVNQLARSLGTSPIFLDAVESTTVKGGPIGGQTAINLRNDHMTYLLTWFTLSAFTSMLWWRRFAKALF